MTLAGIQKTVTALVTGLIGWFAVVIASDADHFHVTNPQWLALAVVVATALGVYAVPNVPKPPPS